jgi:hypothetical protein
VLIRELGQDGKADVVLGESLSVLAKIELYEPFRDSTCRGASMCGSFRRDVSFQP